MIIEARCTEKSKEISVEEAKILIRYTYFDTSEKEKTELEKSAMEIVSRIFPGKDGYIPGVYIEDIASKIGINLEYGCGDIDF